MIIEMLLMWIILIVITRTLGKKFFGTVCEECRFYIIMIWTFFVCIVIIWALLRFLPLRIYYG